MPTNRSIRTPCRPVCRLERKIAIPTVGLVHFPLGFELCTLGGRQTGELAKILGDGKDGRDHVCVRLIIKRIAFLGPLAPEVERAWLFDNQLLSSSPALDQSAFVTAVS